MKEETLGLRLQNAYSSGTMHTMTDKDTGPIPGFAFTHEERLVETIGRMSDAREASEARRKASGLPPQHSLAEVLTKKVGEIVGKFRRTNPPRT